MQKELRDLLTPFIKEHEQLKDSVRPEDVEALLGFAKDFNAEKELLEYIKQHPEGPFWDFHHALDFLPCGAPPGQEDILNDDDDEE